MNAHDTYKHLLGIPYRSGVDDCYGLARQYYRDVYDINIVNIARPDGWWEDPDLDLINQFLYFDKWENLGTNTKILKPGDGLVFSLVSGKANHVGCYVGNGMFIHHVFGRFSCEEALLQKWTNRLLMIARHPGIAAVGKDMAQTTNLMDILPEHIRAKLIRSPRPEGA